MAVLKEMLSDLWGVLTLSLVAIFLITSMLSTIVAPLLWLDDELVSEHLGWVIFLSVHGALPAIWAVIAWYNSAANRVLVKELNKNRGRD